MNSIIRILSFIFMAVFTVNFAQAQNSNQALRSAGVTFSPPPTWSIEDLKEQNSVLLMAPIAEANWQANIFLELREDKENRSLDQALADVSVNLKTRKKGYQELRRSIKQNTKGLQYGLLEYSHKESGTDLIEWEIIVPLRGPSRLFVLTSTAQPVESKYIPVFDAFLNSLSASQ